MDNRWPVHSVCEVCDRVMDTDLKRPARGKGPAVSLWGVTPACRGGAVQAR